MSFGELRNYSTKDALTRLNSSEGKAYFIPDGYEPILIAQSQLTDEVRGEIRRTTAYLRLPVALNECRLPSYIVTTRKTARDQILRLDTQIPVKNPPRPPNAFILYRKSKQAEISAQNEGISNNDVSRIIGNMWKGECDLIRQEFQRCAQEVKFQHKLQYPDYRYKPRKAITKSVPINRAAVASNASSRTHVSRDIPSHLGMLAGCLLHPEHRNGKDAHLYDLGFTNNSLSH